MLPLLADSQASAIEQLCGSGQTVKPDCIATTGYRLGVRLSRISGRQLVEKRSAIFQDELRMAEVEESSKTGTSADGFGLVLVSRDFVKAHSYELSADQGYACGQLLGRVAT
jgi:hypothetical protein